MQLYTMLLHHVLVVDWLPPKLVSEQKSSMPYDCNFGTVVPTCIQCMSWGRGGPMLQQPILWPVTCVIEHSLCA